MVLTSVQSFQLIANKPWEELITQTCYPMLKANLKIVLSRKCRKFVKIIISSAKFHMQIFNLSSTKMHGFKMIHWKL